MYIDTHCHVLSEYYNNIEVIVKKCIENNVTKIIVSGCDMKSNKEVLELVNKYDIIYGTLGFHPTELEDFKEEYFDFLIENINNKKIVGIGEIGLDYHYENTDKEKQRRIFNKQLEIAEKFNRPVVIHSRDAIQEIYDMLSKYNLKGSIHCFSGSLEMAKLFIRLGYKIGVGGIITFKNAKNIIKVIENIDLSYILLETDSPYLSPEPYRGSKNDPSNIPIIAEKLASLKNVSIAEVARVTTSSAEEEFDFFSK